MAQRVCSGSSSAPVQHTREGRTSRAPRGFVLQSTCFHPGSATWKWQICPGSGYLQGWRGMNSTCMNSLFLLAHYPDVLGDDCPALLHVCRFWVEIHLHFNPPFGPVVGTPTPTFDVCFKTSIGIANQFYFSVLLIIFLQPPLTKTNLSLLLLLQKLCFTGCITDMIMPEKKA